MIKGSCLCGRVAYEINGPLTDALNCHCVMSVSYTHLTLPTKA